VRSPLRSTPDEYLNFFFGVENGERSAMGLDAVWVEADEVEAVRDRVRVSELASSRREAASADLKWAGATEARRWAEDSIRSLDCTLAVSMGGYGLDTTTTHHL